ncbi:MAG: TOBE domain-containing protein, partial [Alphaproteobacteria bacterium]|nr:TOBE domain-containing protein [Alphaproteobacteria bacterium]
AVFNEPQTRFVAGFIGESNFLPAHRVGGEADRVVFATAGGRRLAVAASRVRGGGDRFVLAFRPHHVRLAPDGALAGTLADTVYSGTAIRHTLDLGDGVRLSALALSLPGAASPAAGATLRFDVPAEAITAFPDVGA